MSSLVIGNEHHNVKNAREVPYRLLQLMVNYVRRQEAREKDIWHISALYDSTPHFEMGYLMSEIIHRYERIVHVVKTGLNDPSKSLKETQLYVAETQSQFIELFHLVNMVNEIARKYKRVRQFFKKGSKSDSGEDAYAKLERLRREREKEKKRLIKELLINKELTDLQASGGLRKPRKPVNRWWPIDYGWEIDYYW